MMDSKILLLRFASFLFYIKGTWIKMLEWFHFSLEKMTKRRKNFGMLTFINQMFFSLFFSFDKIFVCWEIISAIFFIG